MNGSGDFVLFERFVGFQHSGNACSNLVVDAVAGKLQTAEGNDVNNQSNLI